MEFDWLEDFLALAECQHFSRAAEQRNISQPAFSRRIRLLENWLGAPLFDRATHRIELTAAGEAWKPTAQELLRRVHLGREQVKDVASGEIANLRFASTHALSINFFPQWLESIEAEFPLGAAASLVTDNMAGCEKLMLQGQAHFLLCHHHPSTPVSFKPNYFAALDVGTDVLVPVSAPQPNKPDAPLYALPGSIDQPVPHLAYSDVSGMGRILAYTHALEGPSVWLTPVFRAHVATVLANMARSGRGMAWLPLSVIRSDLDLGALVEAGGPEWRVQIGVRLYRPRARQSPAAEGLWTFLKQKHETLSPTER